MTEERYLFVILLLDFKMKIYNEKNGKKIVGIIL